jgi:hypothetical protein
MLRTVRFILASFMVFASVGGLADETAPAPDGWKPQVIPTAIYDRAGQALAKAKNDPEVVVSEVDLNARQIWYWLGDWQSGIWPEGPPRLQDKK